MNLSLGPWLKKTLSASLYVVPIRAALHVAVFLMEFMEGKEVSVLLTLSSGSLPALTLSLK